MATTKTTNVLVNKEKETARVKVIEEQRKQKEVTASPAAAEEKIRRIQLFEAKEAARAVEEVHIQKEAAAAAADAAAEEARCVLVAEVKEADTSHDEKMAEAKTTKYTDAANVRKEEMEYPQKLEEEEVATRLRAVAEGKDLNVSSSGGSVSFGTSDPSVGKSTSNMESSPVLASTTKTKNHNDNANTNGYVDNVDGGCEDEDEDEDEEDEDSTVKDFFTDNEDESSMLGGIRQQVHDINNSYISPSPTGDDNNINTTTITATATALLSVPRTITPTKNAADGMGAHENDNNQNNSNNSVAVRVVVPVVVAVAVAAPAKKQERTRQADEAHQKVLCSVACNPKKSHIASIDDPKVLSLLHDNELTLSEAIKRHKIKKINVKWESSSYKERAMVLASTVTLIIENSKTDGGVRRSKRNHTGGVRRRNRKRKCRN